MNLTFDPFCTIRTLQKAIKKINLIKTILIFFTVMTLTGCISELPYSLNNSNEMALQQAERTYQQKIIPDLNNIDFNLLNADQKVRYINLRIAITDPTNTNAQIRNYIELEKYGSAEERQNTINETWTYLTSLSNNDQQAITVYPDEATLKGWMDLLWTYQDNIGNNKADNLFSFLSQNQDDSDKQKELLKQNISDWVSRYPAHPAALYLPRSIFGKDSYLIDASQTLNIALFVPQSGPYKIYGDAILTGMRDANLFDKDIGQIKIQVYDTNAHPMQELVDQAEQDKAQMIVGPFMKKNVEAMEDVESSLPILALNRLETAPINDNNICYFSLSPEEEARNTALRIYSQKKKAPLLIVPNSTLGKRIAQSFIEEWTALTEQTELPIQFFDNYNELLNKINNKINLPLTGTLMQLQNNELQPILDPEADEAEEELNQQNDSLYIYATAKEYILINSLLRAETTAIPPIYLSSITNEANLSRDTRYDLNNTQISDIPLLLDQKSIESLPTYIKDDYFLIRLYAMGVDAASLSTRFESLQGNKNSILNGLTGVLNSAPTCNILQTLSWGTFKKGNLTPIIE